MLLLTILLFIAMVEAGKVSWSLREAGKKIADLETLSQLALPFPRLCNWDIVHTGLEALSSEKKVSVHGIGIFGMVLPLGCWNGVAEPV